MNKEITVAFINPKIKKEWEVLKGGKFEDKQLYKFIDRAIDDLKANPSCGIKIEKHLWPKEYTKNYSITNLWKYDLPKAWRLVYTIEQNEVKVMNIILEWFSHKDYEKCFKY